MNASRAHSLGDAFADVVRTRPEHTALVHGDRRLTYRHLGGWAASVADRLGRAGSAGAPVGIRAPRSAGTVATVLGAILAGCAYVPLDPDAPDARLRALVEDFGLRTLCVAHAEADRLRTLLPGVRILTVDEEMPDPAPIAVAPSGPDPLAYVIATSGTTGRPKGVQVEHRAVLTLARAPEAGFRPDDVVLQLAPLHVDPSVFEIWGALLNGATLVLPEAARPGVHDIGREVRRHRVSVLRLAAPLFRLAMEHITDALRGLRLCVSGGDRASAEAVRTALRELPGCRIVNGYGPTETTVYACWLVLDADRPYADDWPDVPIGRPFADATVHVVDRDRRPVAPGEEGELCVGGPGVARGYLGRPELTADRFVPEPGRGGRTAYLTGDRVRLLPDGNLAFLGRTDDQVKIRGHRVEPVGTERALLVHPAVREAAVVAQGTGERRRLAAFVVLREPAAEPDLIAHVAALLPSPQVPVTVTPLTELPLTPNGKTDRPALAGLAGRADGSAEPGLPDTPTERVVAGLWQDALGAPVGTDVDFLAAGGDSLTAMVVLARLERATGVALSVGDLFRAATVRGLAALVDAGTGTSPAVERQPDGTGTAPAGGPQIPDTPGRVPLLPGQEGIWFEQQAAPGKRYVISRTFLVRGRVDVDRLRRALTRLGQRQTALRTVVRQDADGWWQTPEADPGAAVDHHDMTRVPPAEQRHRIRALVTARATADDASPLVRTLVVTLDGSAAVVHFAIHHLIADDWSLELFFTELSALYDDHTAQLPPLRLTFADHVRETLGRLPEREAAALEFWRGALEGGAAAPDLVTDHPRPAVLSGAGDRVRLRIDAAESARYAEAARRHGISRFMFCLAGVHTVLAAHTERDSLCLGSLATGRGRPGTEELVGYFVNLLPIRVEATADTPVTTLFRRVREASAAAHGHHDVPFQTVCRELGAAGVSRATSPFRVVVNHQQHPPRPPRLGPAAVEPWPAAEDDTAKFELTFTFQESPQGLGLEVEFSTDLYRRDTVERLAGQLVAVLGRLADAGSGTVLRDIELLEPGERGRLLAAPESERAPAHPDATLTSLFARAAADHPGKTAVLGEDTALTYRELDRLSDDVAARLLAQGARPGERVALCLERTPLLIGAVLGVLKTGAAYVPLDPAYPAERLRYVLTDARPRALVTTKDISERLFRPGTDADVLPPVLDIDRLVGPSDETPPAREAARATDPAYIIYTSGSTGRPRGVVVSHRSVANTLRANLARHPFTPDDVWLQLTSPGFDVAAYEQFMPLVSGGTLVYCADATRGDAAALGRALRDNGVTVMVIVPSLLRALGSPDLAPVRVLVVAGEPADPHDTRHYARDLVVINGYGPTEAAILATTHEAGPDEDRGRIPIGRALPGTTAHVIDRHGRLAATGVPGELWLGGAGVALGYWNNPERTRDLFTTVPVLGGRRLYRTGDRVRRLPDGALDYLGRLDGQIKLRGFRIELGEIEATLTRHQRIGEAVAVLVGEGPDADLGVAYVGTADGQEARAHLVRHLPGHMVPRLIMPVAHIPTSSHGKADRTALAARLAAHARDRGPAEDTGPAASPLEQGLLALWRKVLGTGPSVGLSDDFFALGGHSLRVIRLLGEIEREYDMRIPVRDFLAEPTVRATAHRLARTDTGTSTSTGTGTGTATVSPEDVVLDPGITFAGPVAAPRRTGSVLLTGATGFVGIHVLRELLDRTEGPVLCLVRATTPETARSRLAQAARRHALALDAADPRIVPLPGDLTLPGLGLTGTPGHDTARAAATVLHLGAEVHHLSGYQHLAAANVGGTQELLRIAAEGRPARFHHVSTLAVLREHTPDGRPRNLSESTPAEHERHPRGHGYAAAKWAAEHLVRQAVARGADARTYRLGRAGASATTGALSHDDMLTRLLVSSAALGCYPDHPALASDALPVDVMAGALVALALADAPPGTVHHLHHPRRTGLGVFLAGHDRRTGSRTHPVGLRNWLGRLDEAVAQGTELPALAYREHLRELCDTPGPAEPARYRNEATLAALRTHGITPPDWDDAVIDRFWQYLAPTEETSE
ncbi:non-ribosomal peptide synthetase [Streptomyces herbicida]|uniref:non-ribosomal peptide synthetase n=1 Tax=Streptomyces herbicida TaxID=3065675 RepID=UPI00293129FD|nr:non-ribosomal peptide synthetase [Streptomyces sp. NEAU-HV9]